MMTDMEGISGINSADFVDPSHWRYAEGRRWLTSDVNAAVEGAFEGGADVVIVDDAHGGAPHILNDLLDPRALFTKPASARNWTPGLDETFTVCFSIGTHAKAGTPDAFLEHTQSSRVIFRYTLAGIEMGELGQFAVIAGWYGVPVGLVTGDEAACREAKELLGPEVVTVPVKKAVGRNVAICRHPKETAALIREAAREVVKNGSKVKPLKVSFPCEAEIVMMRSDFADERMGRPGVVRVDSRTIRWTANNPAEFWV